jgi:hypothetical protein
VFQVAGGRICHELDLDGHDSAVVALDDQIDFAGAVVGAQVACRGLAGLGVHADIESDQRLEERSRECAVPGEPDRPRIADPNQGDRSQAVVRGGHGRSFGDDYRVIVAGLSIDYESIASALRHPVDLGQLGAALLEALGDYYAEVHGDSALLFFQQNGATYLFDHASSNDTPHDDRTVAAWALTPARVSKRDVGYQRGFPLASDQDTPVDRGHLIPHLSGGEFGPNIFRQDRSLNRGWSEAGKKYRAMEREAAERPGSFYFGHLLYGDDSDWPSEIETGVFRDGRLVVERFVNRRLP